MNRKLLYILALAGAFVATDSFAISVTNLDKVERQVIITYPGGDSRKVLIEAGRTYHLNGPVVWLNVPGDKRVMAREDEGFVVDKDGIYIQRRNLRTIW